MGYIVSANYSVENMEDKLKLELQPTFGASIYFGGFGIIDFIALD